MKKRNRIFLLVFASVLNFAPLFGQSDWIPRNPFPFRPDVFGIHLSDSQTIYMPRVAGDKHFISINGGKFWSNVKTPGLNFGEGAIYTFHFPSKRIGYQAAVNQNIMCKSIDGGINWQSFSIPYFFNSLSFANDTLGYAAKYATATPNKILKTTNSGQTWTDLNTPTSSYSNSFVRALSKDIVLCFSDSSLFRSIDGGFNWIKLSTFSKSLDNYNHMKLCESFGKYVFLANTKPDKSIFYKSVNFGASWDSTQIVFQNPNDRVVSMDFIDSLNGWFASMFAMYRTTNGGSTWNEISTYTPFPSSLTYLKAPNYIQFYDENIGYYVTYNGDFYKTSNGGLAWAKMNKGVTDVQFKGIAFQSKSRPWLVGGFNDVATSDDNGKNWKFHKIDSTDVLYSIDFINSREGFIGGGSSMFLTKNGGRSWTKRPFIDSLGFSITPTFLASGIYY